jgi:hypothetical protein
MGISLCRPTGGVTDNGLRCEPVEPRRSYPGDGEQRWYDGEDWERGRHGAPASPGGAGAPYSGEAGAPYSGEAGAAYNGEAGAAYSGEGPYNGQAAPYSGAEGYGDDGYERRFNSAARFGDPLTDSSSGVIPAVQADSVGPVGSAGSVEGARRPVEAIDVGALRRPPVSAPPDDQSQAYSSGPPPEFPPVNYAPSATAYSGPAGDPPAYSAGDPPVYPGGDQPVYPAGSTYGAGNSPLSAPTAAVNTIQPGRPSVYHSRKPAIAIVLAVLTVLFEIPALRLLVSATIEDVVSVPGVVSGTFLVLGLPVFGYGVYGLLNGTPPSSLSAWLRQPLVYLPLGVLLFVLAALAAA